MITAEPEVEPSAAPEDPTRPTEEPDTERPKRFPQTNPRRFIRQLPDNN